MSIELLIADLHQYKNRAWCKAVRRDTDPLTIDKMLDAIEWFSLGEGLRTGLSYHQAEDGVWKGTFSVSHGTPASWKKDFFLIVQELAGELPHGPPEMREKAAHFTWEVTDYERYHYVPEA